MGELTDYIERLLKLKDDEITTLRAQLAAARMALDSAHQFSDENIDRLTKLHGQALTRVEALEKAGDNMALDYPDRISARHWRTVRGGRP